MATLIGNVGMVMRGDWNQANTYELLNAVTYQNGLYIAKKAVPANTLPTNTEYWQLAVDLGTIASQVNAIAAKITTPFVAVSAIDTTENDANNIKTSGVYTVRSTGTANLPSTGIWELLVISYVGGARCMQFCTAAGAGTVYFRGYNGSAWDNWTTL